MKKIKSWQADLSLLLVAAVWGSSFITVKQSTADIPTFTFLALRFTIASVILLPFRPWRKFSKSTLLRGAVIGVLLFLGYAFQTLGLQYVSAAKAGFITGLSCVIVPLIVAIEMRKIPSLKTIAGVLLATGGLALLSLEGYSFAMGDFLVLLCAVAFALHIYSVDKLGAEENSQDLTIIQLMTVAVLSFISRLIFELDQPLIFSTAAIQGVLITALLSTSFAFLIQNTMQKYTTPTHTALIFASEPVFSYLFAFLLAGEQLTVRNNWGAGLIMAGIILAELKLPEKTEN